MVVILGGAPRAERACPSLRLPVDLRSLSRLTPCLAIPSVGSTGGIGERRIRARRRQVAGRPAGPSSPGGRVPGGSTRRPEAVALTAVTAYGHPAEATSAARARHSALVFLQTGEAVPRSVSAARGHGPRLQRPPPLASATRPGGFLRIFNRDDGRPPPCSRPSPVHLLQRSERPSPDRSIFRERRSWTVGPMTR